MGLQFCWSSYTDQRSSQYLRRFQRKQEKTKKLIFGQQLILSRKIMKKKFLIEKFITILILFRSYLKQLPLWAFIGLLFILYYTKYRKEGYTYTIVFYFLGTALVLCSQLMDIKFLLLAGLLIVVGTNFIRFDVHYIPFVKPFVGFRQETLVSGLYTCDFYPLESYPPPKIFYRKWADQGEMDLMYKNFTFSRKITRGIFDLVTSYIDKYRVYFGYGKEVESDQLILFSHGRGVSPSFHTFLLMSLAQKRKVVTLQQSDLIKNPFRDPIQAKRFREEEVKKRTFEFIEMFDHYSKNYKRITLMGHSYGCPTVFLAYHQLKTHQNFKSITNLVLLDPWFYPLSSTNLQLKVQKPILILANEYYVNGNDIHARNKQFCEIHNPAYLCWKDGDHMHQTDLPFIISNNPFQKIHCPEKAEEMLRNNVKCIDAFIQGKQIFQVIEEKYRLPEEWEPAVIRNIPFYL